MFVLLIYKNNINYFNYIRKFKKHDDFKSIMLLNLDGANNFCIGFYFLKTLMTFLFFQHAHNQTRDREKGTEIKYDQMRKNLSLYH